MQRKEQDYQTGGGRDKQGCAVPECRALEEELSGASLMEPSGEWSWQGTTWRPMSLQSVSKAWGNTPRHMDSSAQAAAQTLPLEQIKSGEGALPSQPSYLPLPGLYCDHLGTDALAPKSPYSSSKGHLHLLRPVY